MKSLSRRRVAAMATLGMAFLPTPSLKAVRAQDDVSPRTILLSRAKILEQRGRLDLAQQDWAQVLLIDPGNAEALSGMVRSSRAAGHTADANNYFARLRAAHPNDPELARLEAAAKAQDSQIELTEAARLARAGDARAAMVLYRRVYGANPPVGQPALAYFETEAATDEGRPHAIAGLRALTDRFPAETRYGVALGRVLLSSPRTRAEGRTLLERYPGNAEAVAALHASAAGTPTQVASSEVPAASPASKPPPAANARTVSPVESADSATNTRPNSGLPPARINPATPDGPVRASAAQGTAAEHHLAFAVDDQAAYAALNQHRLAEAEQRFNQILAKDPKDSRALAGLGYMRVTTGDLKAAVGYFEQAQENGDHSLALTRAMVNAQFELGLQHASAQRAKGDLAGAEGRYREALRERPNDPEALDGLAETLVQQNRAGDAVSVFRRLTEVRPMSPAAWRGLVIAQANSGKGAAALATDAQVPAAAKAPLQRDATYQITLASVRGAQPAQAAQVARAEPPGWVTMPPRPGRPAATPKVAPSIPPPADSPSAAPVVVHPSPQPAAPKAGKSAGPAKTPEQIAASNSVPVKVSRPASSAPVPAAAAPVIAAPPPPPENDAIVDRESHQPDLALMHGENAEAATLFHDVLTHAPEKAAAWRGLVLSLQRNGHEREAADALGAMPPEARLALDRDASFQSAAGAVYLASDRPGEALHALARAQDVFSSQHLAPPLTLVLQMARLLSARADDENLFRELMYLGERKDLTDAQRSQVQLIWTQWAVRRARALSAAGEDSRAVVLLNAAAVAFAGNGEVLRAVATGYAGVGRPREAVALYKTQDVGSAPAPVIEAAIEVATAARDFKTAQGWVHVGLSRFGQDPQMLTVAAGLEQARGHERRAVELSQQAKAIAPPQDPGQVLAAELKEAKAGSGWIQHPVAAGQLNVLLSPSDPALTSASHQPGRPYLPTPVETGSAPARMSAVPVLAGYDEPSR